MNPSFLWWREVKGVTCTFTSYMINIMLPCPDTSSLPGGVPREHHQEQVDAARQRRRSLKRRKPPSSTLRGGAFARTGARVTPTSPPCRCVGNGDAVACRRRHILMLVYCRVSSRLGREDMLCFSPFEVGLRPRCTHSSGPSPTRPDAMSSTWKRRGPTTPQRYHTFIAVVLRPSGVTLVALRMRLGGGAAIVGRHC